MRDEIGPISPIGPILDHSHSPPVAPLLFNSSEVYQEMLERLEDADDIAWLKEARKKPQSCRKLAAVLAGLGIEFASPQIDRSDWVASA
jgi:hypothetical protein